MTSISAICRSLNFAPKLSHEISCLNYQSLSKGTSFLYFASRRVRYFEVQLYPKYDVIFGNVWSLIELSAGRLSSWIVSRPPFLCKSKPVCCQNLALFDFIFQDSNLFSVFLCLRLVVQPTNVLEELRDRITISPPPSVHQNVNMPINMPKEAKPTTCRRVKRSNIAQSFSMGTGK